MTEDKKNYVTAEGLKKLQQELHELKTVKRKEIAQRIADAKELGDLSENAEYHDAKDEQGKNESRVIELEQVLKNTEVIKHRKNTKKVQLGSQVTVQPKGGSEMSFTIVGSAEADPSKQLISNESPLGQAFLGKDVGEEVEVDTPAGATTYAILKAA